MKHTVLITGANSFIAKHLIPLLQDKYHIKLLTRNPTAPNEYAWNLENWTIDEKALDDVDYIVHLAGSKLNDGSPLTEERKKLVYDSRIGATTFLKDKLKARNQQLIAFVSASAIGYYGFNDNSLTIDEDGNRGVGFNADLSDDWEKAADKLKTEGVAQHVSKIRVSLVLGNDGGIFPHYKDIIKTNPAVANQKNDGGYPWNHVDDMAGIFAFAIAQNLDGVYNSVAPTPASMQDIFKAIANQTHLTKHAITPFNGQHLVSTKIIAAGYQFKYPTITEAVNNLIPKN